MKLGLGFYRHRLNDEHYRYARQCGATHAVVHLVDFFSQGRANARSDQPIGDLHGWGFAGDPNQLWPLVELNRIKRDLNRPGLEWEAIENFDPAHWHDILLDGPKRAEQIEKQDPQAVVAIESRLQIQWLVRALGLHQSHPFAIIVWRVCSRRPWRQLRCCKNPGAVGCRGSFRLENLLCQQA